ncbi:competence protein CoiA family protein [Mycolicibacterium fortuitum]
MADLCDRPDLTPIKTMGTLSTAADAGDLRSGATATWDYPCGLEKMTSALGPHGQYIDIRKPQNLDYWHYRQGLRCMVCNWEAHVHARQPQFFIQHNPGPSPPPGELASRSAHALESYQHETLKFWVRDQLRMLGMSARVERGVDSRRPDVSAHLGDRVVAVEVQWSPLDIETARARTTDLQAAGCDVLWLVRHCSWLGRLPALSIVDFDPPDGQYQCLTGRLGITENAILVPARGRYPLVEFLRGWVATDLAWGYAKPRNGGWTTVANWEKYTAAQCERIAHRDQRIAELVRDCDSAQRRIVELTRDCVAAQQLVANRDTVVQQQRDEVSSLTSKLARATESIAKLRPERDNAVRIARKMNDERASLQQRFEQVQLRNVALTVAVSIVSFVLFLCFLSSCVGS